MNEDLNKLREAYRLHQQGQLVDAANIYEELIRRDSKNYDALHFLGTIKAYLGDISEAKILLERSLASKKNKIAYVENYASILFMSQEYNRAVQICTTAIVESGNTETLLYVLAISLYKQSRLNEAIDQFDLLLSLYPNHLAGNNEKGSVLAEMKRYDEAFVYIENALRMNPRYADALLNKGNVLAKNKKYDDSILAYEQALAINPNIHDAHLGSGNVFRKLKRYDKAFAAYDKALALKPDLENAWLGRGNVFSDLKRYDEAIAAYDKALALKPDLENVWLGRGNVFSDLKRYDEAFAAYDKALALKPDFAEAWLGRGNVFSDLKRHDEAFAAYDKALALEPDFAEAWLGRGNVFSDLKRHDEAFAAYDKALALKPDLAKAYNSRGVLLNELMHLENAIADYDKAIKIEPNGAEAYFNKSLSLLLIGKFNEGWKLFEWRWRTRSMRSSCRNLLQPLWSGTEPLVGKSILLYGEQGLGDTIQFCRYVELVADLGAKVILEVPKPLLRLLANLSGVAQLVEAGSALPPFDFQCPLMSLPLAFKTDLSNIPENIPYIKSEPNKSEYWNEKLGERSKPRVGLVWSGGFRPNQPELWRVNERRNIALVKFATLKDVDLEFYSLQKGHPAESELSELVKNNWGGPHIIDFTSELRDFSDTAAFIDNLDLLISVDTSTAHLVGAMGKPVWILSRFDTDWRWLLDRTDSPWYPTAKLYRQETAGNWDGVLKRVRSDLISLFP